MSASDTLRQLSAALGQMRGQLQEAAQALQQPAGDALVQAAQGVVPRRSGDAAQSLRMDGNTLHGSQVLAWGIDGTSAHEIRPVSKKALYWEGAEHPVRAVHHPGTKANDWRPDAVAAAIPEAATAGQQALQDVVEQFRGAVQ